MAIIEPTGNFGTTRKNATTERIGSLKVRTTAHAATARKLEPPEVCVATMKIARTQTISARMRSRN
jgi:hypothetical protein